jgi:hypothetical protein
LTRGESSCRDKTSLRVHISGRYCGYSLRGGCSGKDLPSALVSASIMETTTNPDETLTGSAAAEPTPALADAEAAAAATEVSPTADEVEGRGEPLLTLIEQGDIDAPERPLAWTEWTRWRSASGQRPRVAGAFTLRESRLWRTTMEALFGLDWRRQLALPQQSVPPSTSGSACRVYGERSPTTGRWGREDVSPTTGRFGREGSRRQS